MRKGILAFTMLVFFSNFIFAMGGKPMNEPKDLMRPDTGITLSREEANKLLKDIREKVDAELPGVDVSIRFEAYDDFKLSARSWQPDLWIGNWAVEYAVRGADTTALREIRETVKQIILAVKKQLKF